MAADLARRYTTLTMSASPPVSAEAVAAALERILESQEFAQSWRLKALLRYLVDKTLRGEQGELKEYSIALAVFERAPSFDPKEDTIVRAQARRLRQYWRPTTRLPPGAAIRCGSRSPRAATSRCFKFVPRPRPMAPPPRRAPCGGAGAGSGPRWGPRPSWRWLWSPCCVLWACFRGRACRIPGPWRKTGSPYWAPRQHLLGRHVSPVRTALRHPDPRSRSDRRYRRRQPQGGAGQPMSARAHP